VSVCLTLSVTSWHSAKMAEQVGEMTLKCHVTLNIIICSPLHGHPG